MLLLLCFKILARFRRGSNGTARFSVASKDLWLAVEIKSIRDRRPLETTASSWWAASGWWAVLAQGQPSVLKASKANYP